MRYVITQNQFHRLIYVYLNDMFSKKDFRKELNPYVTDGNTWRVDLFNDKGRPVMSYYWYGPGEYDNGVPHNGVGELSVHYEIVNTLKGIFQIRTSKILDIVADWVSETLNVDIDDVDIYPKDKSRD